MAKFIPTAQPINGIIFDVGLSSMQIDDENRGFLFGSNVPLDLRMGVGSDYTAFDVVNGMSEDFLAKIIKDVRWNQAAIYLIWFSLEKKDLQPKLHLELSITAQNTEVFERLSSFMIWCWRRFRIRIKSLIGKKVRILSEEHFRLSAYL